MGPSSVVRLGDLAHARSGDKGNRANVAVIANDPAAFAWLDEHLSESLVADYLRPMGVGSVVRYRVPNVGALNFVIDRALAGGASQSLRIDTQGKVLGTVILELPVPAPPPPSPEADPS